MAKLDKRKKKPRGRKYTLRMRILATISALVLMLGTIFGFLIATSSTKEEITVLREDLSPTVTPTPSPSPTPYPSPFRLSGMGHHYQIPEFPAGGAIMAVWTVMDYYELPFDPYEFADQYLETSDLFYTNSGVLMGEHPQDSQIGSPYDENGYGVYPRPVSRALDTYCKTYNYAYEPVIYTYVEMSTLVNQTVGRGIPVIVWTDLGTRTNEGDWDVLGMGDHFFWIPSTQCMVVYGYDESTYLVSNPGSPTPYSNYTKTAFAESYDELHRYAMALVKK